MIHAAFHTLAWGLIVVLIWASFNEAPPAPRGPLAAIASLDESTYLAVHKSDGVPVLGLLRAHSDAVHYRSLSFNDWEGALSGGVLAACGVPRYHGEVLALVANGRERRLVHVQLRNWGKTPKFAVLGATEVAEPWLSMACGVASDHSMAVWGLHADTGELRSAHWAVPSYQLDIDEGSVGVPKDWLAALNAGRQAALYASEDAFWLALVDDAGSEILGWKASEPQWRPVYRIDGYSVTGLAAGPEGKGVSIVTGDTGMGSTWRPLPWPANSEARQIGPWRTQALPVLP
ncbi:hypothetical protein [Simiduia aestuariiviva]|uniref:Uncharacterized protein n=1 Tax=Simiduia aestuariiviva TaxID=1510459 RepID=A0A839UUK7_9GAMM|nr:hypothetical protein [Simiduia aestuariiviva]MBB3169178.1 hypothetical protein [Simiduia aestuariiviva]